jgi:hypothetical protein
MATSNPWPRWEISYSSRTTIIDVSISSPSNMFCTGMAIQTKAHYLAFHASISVSFMVPVICRTAHLGLHSLENEGITVLLHIRKCVPSDMVEHPKRLGSSETPL